MRRVLVAASRSLLPCLESGSQLFCPSIRHASLALPCCVNMTRLASIAKKCAQHGIALFLLRQLLKRLPFVFWLQGVGRITSYAPSRAANSTSGPSSSAAGGGSSSSGGNVLNSREREALADHPGLIELVEFMLVGDAHWRPGAPEVVCKAQLLLATVEASAASN